MGRKPAVVFFFFLLFCSFLASNIRPTNAGTITVPNDYYSIQAAINAAGTGDTVFVRSGIYFEHVVVGKTVSLIGENKTSTIIDGSGTGTVVTVSASNVNISGFTIQNSNVSTTSDGGIVLVANPRSMITKANITENVFLKTLYGLRIYGTSEDNYISNNDFRDVSYAIGVESTGNRIFRNSILNCERGITVSLGSPYHSVNASIADNYVTFINGPGIVVSGGKSAQFLVRNNTIMNSSAGILVSGGMSSVFEGNNVTKNSIGISISSNYGLNQFSNNKVFSNAFGIILGVHPGPGSGNIFRNNTMTNNTLINFGFRGLFPDSLPDYVQDADTSNTINGKPIFYLVNKQNLTITDTNQYSFIAIVNSTKISVKNVNITGNIASDVIDRSSSFIFAYTTNSSIGKLITDRSFLIGSNNTVVENSGGLFDFIRSYNNTLRNNDGASLSFRFSNGNRFFNNTSTSISLAGSNGSIIEGNSDCSINLLYGWSPWAKNPWSTTNSIVINNSLTTLSIYKSNNNTIGNNTITGPYSKNIEADYSYGIFLNGANNTITHNVIKGFAQGISSNYFLINDNTLFGNIVINNTLGINIRGNGNVLRRNTLANNRFNVYGEGLIDSDFDSSNTVDGKPAYLLFNQSNVVIDPSTYPNIGYLGLVSSENVTISNLTLTNNVEGILIYNSNNVTVINSILRENAVGLEVTGILNKIINNTVTDNLHGVSVLGQGHDVISGNMITSNTYFNLDPENQDFKNGKGMPYYLGLLISFGSYPIEGGLFIGSGNNTISSNTIMNNLRGIILSGGNNTLRDNQLSGNTLNLAMDYSRKFNLLVQDMDSSNKVDGKRVYYWVNQSDKQVPEDAGFVALINSTNITMKNLNITRNRTGIYLAGVENITVTNTTITDCVAGIYITTITDYYNNPLRSSKHNLITNSTITETEIGIAIWPANDTIISKNILSENMISVWLGFGSYNIIEDNTITNNSVPWNEPLPFPVSEALNPISILGEEGAIVIDSANNILRENTIAYNEVGLTVGSPAIGSPGGNLIYHNNFINNTEQVRVGSLNFWDNGYPEGGNYFSDYTGTDNYSGIYQNETGSDGIGDTPYDLMQSSTWWQRYLSPQNAETLRWVNYPLMKPYPWASHDLGITQATTPKTIATNGTSLPITVGVFNYGNSTEEFTLTIEANSTILSSYPNMTLPSHSSTTLTFLWNTTYSMKGNYTISIQITVVSGETDTSDNTCTLKITLTIPGDCNGDFMVNNDDAVLAQQAWQSSLGQVNYNPNIDFNNDGIIDIVDAAKIGINWQKHA